MQRILNLKLNGIPVGDTVHSQHMHHMHTMKDLELPHKHMLHNPAHTHSTHSIDLDPSVVPTQQVIPTTIINYIIIKTCINKFF